MSAAVPELRTRVMTLVEAAWEDQTGALQTVHARMEDKSPGGARLRVKTPVRLGSRLRVQWRFEQFSGIVKYCRSEGREYVVGIQRDATYSPIPNRPVSADLPPRQTVSRTHPPVVDPRILNPPVSTTKSESPPPRQETKPGEIPESQRKFDNAAISRSATVATEMPPSEIRHDVVRHQLNRRDRPAMAQSQDLDAPRQTELPTERTVKRKEPDHERKHMVRKWFGLAPSPNKQHDPRASGEESSNRTSEKENVMSQATQPTEKAPMHSAREVPAFQIELLPMEDIYRTAGIMSPRRGYSVNKIVEMLNSEHIRALSKEMKRAAVLMALDAAGVSIDQVQRDAKSRQEALDAYEAGQKKQAEAEWARKGEEIAQIQAELESIKAHYTARINRNLESVARDKARFSNWQTTKQQEAQGMSEALELCLKSPVSEPASTPPSELSLAASAGVSAVPVGSKPL